MTRGTLLGRPVTRRRALAALGWSAAVGVLAGCASLPRSGGVTRSDAVENDDSGLVQTAAGPADGATVEQIVSGFLRACEAGFSDDFATARSFLLGPVSKSWEPLDVVRVYQGSKARVIEVADDGAVSVSAEQTASLDSSGVLTQVDGATLDAAYSLATNAGGQWRIVDLPGGILLPSSALADNFVARPVYFLARDRRRLVPDLRFLPRRDGEKGLVEALLGGPADWLAPAVTTAVPTGLALVDDGVVTGGGSAQVSLSEAVESLTAAQRALLVAQLSATLTQVDGIDAVTASSGPDDLGAAADLPEPGASPGALVGMSGGSVVRGASSTRTALVTSDVLGTKDARYPALGADGAVYVLSGASLLRVGAGERSATAVLSADTDDPSKIVMLPPVVDRHGWVWTASAGALTVVNAQGQRARVDADWLTDGIEAIDLSAESERLLVRTGGPDITLAAIVRDEGGAPTGLGEAVRVLPGSGARKGLAWYDPTELCLLADPADGDDAPVVRSVQTPGTQSSSPGAQGAVAVVANRADGTVLLMDDSHQVWQRVGATWRVVSTDVTDVSYPLV